MVKYEEECRPVTEQQCSTVEEQQALARLASLSLPIFEILLWEGGMFWSQHVIITRSQFDGMISNDF